MCGRLVVASSAEERAAWLAAAPIGEHPPASWNVAPGSLVSVVAVGGAGRRLGTMRWGLVPSWSTEPLPSTRPFNARAETLTELPSFSRSVQRRRCVVPVDGFYEWRTGSGGARPYHLSAFDGSPLALAGIWDRRPGPDGEGVSTFAVVTTAANPDVAPLHDRMPVLLSRRDCEAWLDPALDDTDELGTLLRSARPGTLLVREVSRRVNSVRNDGPELLLAPADAQLPFPA
jgi:putative SOS response-associated peptidase YedK